MSGSNIKATVNTPIPQNCLTDFEVLMLSEHGFAYQEDDGHCYFYTRDRLKNHFKQYSGIHIGDIQEALSFPENKSYFNNRQEITNTNYQSIFQNIIRRNDNLSVIAVEGVSLGEHTHQDVQPGQFSGFVELITESKVIMKDTRQFLRDAYDELGSSPVLTKAQANDNDNDFVMADDGRSVRIGIGEASLYIVPTDEDLTVLLYAHGQKIDDPAGMIHNVYADNLPENSNGM